MNRQNQKRYHPAHGYSDLNLFIFPSVRIQSEGGEEAEGPNQSVS